MRVRAVLFASIVLAVLGLPRDQAYSDTATLTDSDQDQIDEALLVYSQSHPSTFLGANKVTIGYLTVREDDPSNDLLEALQKDGFGFKPGSESKHDGSYAVSIGSFAPTSSAAATGELFAYSRDSGGAVESYTVKKISDRWTVDGYQLLQIVLVATPAAYRR